MSHDTCRWGVLVVLFCSATAVAATDAGKPVASLATPAQAAPPEHKPGELLVRLRPGISKAQASALAEAAGGSLLPLDPTGSADSPFRWQLLRLSQEADLTAARGQLLSDARVERVELNQRLGIAELPNDPDFSQLWGLHNEGQTGGRADADIDAPEAWALTTGSHAVRVAVIDTGIAYSHPDLAANVWTNPGEVPGNGVDDDGDGFVDDVHGYDFRNEDGDPWDDHGHGTHVAGTIAAVGSNGLGVVGVSWQASVIGVKFLGADGWGWTSDAVRGVLFAAAKGARVMNNSWGGGGFSDALRDAIAVADAKGALFVAAAGNDASDNDTDPHYPANYDVPNVVAVAATDDTDALASFSDWGRHSVHLGAPGVAILSTVPGGYAWYSGTSMAAPHVSGVAALIAALSPGAGPEAIKERLLAGVDPVPALATRTISGGRLNARSALSCLGGCVLEIDDVGVTEGDDGTADAVLTVTLNQASTSPISVDYATVDGSARAGSDYVAASGRLGFEPGATTQTLAVQVLGEHVYERDETFAVMLRSPDGAQIRRATGTVAIPNDDPLPTLSFDPAPVAVPEPASGTALATAIVRLSAPSEPLLSFVYRTCGGTAFPGRDYRRVRWSRVFVPSLAESVPLGVSVLSDQEPEPDESFFLQIARQAPATSAACARHKQVTIAAAP